MSTHEESPCKNLTFEDALLDQNKVKIPLTFRKVAPLPEDFIKPIEAYVEGDGDIPVPIRQLLPHGTHSQTYQDLPSPLNMKIGDCLGSGRTSFVFEAEPLYLPPGSSIPPLVAKFGLPGFSKFLLREAWFYEEMQTLQGEVIPWCYGLYYARIPRGTVAFLPWFRGEFRTLWKEDISELDKSINKEEQLLRFVQKCAREKDKEAVAKEESALEYLGNFKEEYTQLVQQFDDTTSSFDSNRPYLVVPVLILEKLGKPFLPLGGKNWPMNKPIPEDVTKEIFDAYEKLSELGITHMDIKYSNILAAPFPTLRCENDHDLHGPGCNRSYNCRIIDFEMSMKSNFTKERLIYGDDSYIHRLIRNLPYGLALGQNDDR